MLAPFALLALLLPPLATASFPLPALPSCPAPLTRLSPGVCPVEDAPALHPIARPRPKSHFNYASLDCGARLHNASPQSQHASSILHKSRDRYMLTPCRADQHWVTIELCDEIRIDAIEIAVWEFFSGIVREVVVSAGDEDQMQQIATFVGKNVRGAQTFSLEPTLFSRFIRLDFPSHYGSEFYCPVSQIKVYGMNQLEAFKWEKRKPEPIPEPIPIEIPKLDPILIEMSMPEPEERRGESESIYATITRRLDALEKHQHSQQMQIIRALNSTQSDLYQWRIRQESNQQSRWEQERMRQEDRLGAILSQLEHQRARYDADRISTEGQLRSLTEQLLFEQRRGIAQIVILMVVIAIGVATRSNTINTLLEPILTEGRKRKVSLRRDYRSSLPARGPARKLARSSHLHAM